MSEVCPRCLMRFPHHVVIEARCTRRWRGANFDASAAQGNVGAAIAHVMGVDAKSKQGFEAFLRRVVIQPHGERRNVSDEVADPSTGERFEFHIGLREGVDADMLARIEAAARDAIAKSRSFELS